MNKSSAVTCDVMFLLIFEHTVRNEMFDGFSLTCPMPDSAFSSQSAFKTSKDVVTEILNALDLHYLQTTALLLVFVFVFLALRNNK